MSKEIVRLATVQDIPPLMEGIKLAKKQLFYHHSGQWQNGEPSENTITKDIHIGQYFVVEFHQQIVGGMALLFHEPAYDKLFEGAWLNAFPYGVIHRFFIHPSFQGKGLAKLLLDHAQQVCFNKGIFNLRIDTHQKNIPMKSLLIKCGFREVGKAFLPDAGERVVYHKVYE